MSRLSIFAYLFGGVAFVEGGLWVLGMSDPRQLLAFAQAAIMTGLALAGHWISQK